MSNSAITTQGVALKRGDGGGTEVFTLIPEIYSLNGPNETNKQVDVTSFDADAREFIGGLPDGGEIQIEANFIPGNAQHQGLHSDFTARTARNFELHLTDDDTTPTKIAFTALVLNYGLKAGIDDRVTLSATLKLSGAPSYTYHA